MFDDLHKLHVREKQVGMPSSEASQIKMLKTLKRKNLKKTADQFKVSAVNSDSIFLNSIFQFPDLREDFSRRFFVQNAVGSP